MSVMTVVAIKLRLVIVVLSYLFFQGDLDDDLPTRKKTDVCTIMYTSGTTGEPKGVILSNATFMGAVSAMDQLLIETDKKVRKYTSILFNYVLPDFLNLTESINKATHCSSGYRRGCILLVPSTSPHIRPNYSNLLHSPWFFDWFLAGGKINILVFYYSLSSLVNNELTIETFKTAILLNLQDIRYLIEDLLVLKPTIFCGVPRVFDRIYTGAKPFIC